MSDAYLLLAPIVLLVIVALLRFVGCSFHTETLPAAPTFNPPPGGYISPQSITMTSDAGTQILFSTDGSTPTTPYTGPVPLSSTTTLKAIAQGTSASEANFIGGTSTTTTGKYYVGPVGWVQKTETDGGAGGTSTPAFANPTGQGNLIVVWIFYQSAAVQVASVSDGANTYHQACPPTAMPNNPQFSQEIWYAWDIAAASGVAVSAAFSGATPVEVQVSAHEYSNAYQEPDGPLADTPPPGSAGANGTSIGTVSLMTRGRLVFGASIVRDGQEAPGAGFTPRSTLANNMAEDMNVPSPSTPVAATFGNPASEDWAAQMITLK